MKSKLHCLAVFAGDGNFANDNVTSPKNIEFHKYFELRNLTFPFYQNLHLKEYLSIILSGTNDYQFTTKVGFSNVIHVLCTEMNKVCLFTNKII